MFDTSIYGKLVEDKDVFNEVDKKSENHEFVIYGTQIIRNELRATLKSATYEKRKLRILLLNVYDNFVKEENRDLKFNKLVETLAVDYFMEYKKNKGSLSNEAIRNDLIIIATATIYQLDIVISDDEKTMLADNLLYSYKLVNKRYGIKDPIFKKYSQFKKELLR